MAKVIYQFDFNVSTNIRVFVHADENDSYADAVAEGEALAYDVLGRMKAEDLYFDLVEESAEFCDDDYDGPDRTED
jgi:hypothetical protein